jgi:hypothetical protein
VNDESEHCGDVAALSAHYSVDGPYDLFQSARWLDLGRHCPTLRISQGVVMLGTWTPQGPATLEASVQGQTLHVKAWGDGAQCIIDARTTYLGTER